MGDFKIVKQAEQAPEYSDPIKRKIDLAAAEGLVYELDDEDRRIDALYKNNNLSVEKRLLSLDRVYVRNKEYLVASVEYSFYDNNTGAQTDRYIDYIGRTEKPQKIFNSQTNSVTVASVKKVDYDIEFSADKVDSFLKDYGYPSSVDYRFYTATNNSNTDTKPVEVKRKEFFANATWEELIVGKEKKYTSSTQNKLPTLRKEIDYEERQQFAPDNNSDEVKTRTNKEVTTNITLNDNNTSDSNKELPKQDNVRTKDTDVVVTTKNEPPTKKQQQVTKQQQ